MEMPNMNAKPTGRPPIDPEQRKSHNITFRARGVLHLLLTEAAKQSGRSLSEEVEFRLKNSFPGSVRRDLMAGIHRPADDLEANRSSEALEKFNEAWSRLNEIPDQTEAGDHSERDQIKELKERVEILEKITQRDRELLKQIGQRVWDLTHEPERVEEARRALDFRGRARKKDDAA
jgi:hypothetical protein